MKTKTIKQKVKFAVPPQKIYKAITDSKVHSDFTGERATGGGKVGEKFSAYSKYITGVTVELVPNERIVQAWRSEDWPEGHYSIVEYRFKKAPKKSTVLEFTHFGVPPKDYVAKKKGWKDHYWEPLKDYFYEL